MIIARAEEAASRGDFSLLTKLFADDVEWRSAASGPHPQVIWIGRDEVSRQIADVSGRAADGWEVEEVREQGDDVLVICREWREVPGSDLRVTQQTATRFRFSAGRVVLVEQFWTLEEALASAP